MANTSYPKEKMFVPVDCQKAAFEDISLKDAMRDLKSMDIDVFKEQIEINEVETLDVLDSLLDDFSCVDLKKEVVDIRNFIARPHKKKTFKKRIMNLLNTDVSTPICEALNTDVSAQLQELISMDLTAPLQEVFDNLITMISTNKQD